MELNAWRVSFVSAPKVLLAVLRMRLAVADLKVLQPQLWFAQLYR